MFHHTTVMVRHTNYCSGWRLKCFIKFLKYFQLTNAMVVGLRAATVIDAMTPRLAVLLLNCLLLQLLAGLSSASVRSDLVVETQYGKIRGFETATPDNKKAEWSTHWSLYWALIGPDTGLSLVEIWPLLRHKDTAEGTQSPLLGAFLVFRCVLMASMHGRDLLYPQYNGSLCAC